MRKPLILLSAVITIIGLCLFTSIVEVQGVPLAQSELPQEIDQVIWDAIQQEIASRPEGFLFEAYDWQLSQVTYSTDQTHAVVWLDPLDSLTGMTLATEPMVVIAVLLPGKPANESNSWEVTFQGDEDWINMAAQVAEMLPQELTQQIDTTVPKVPEVPLAALGGYKLPWAAGSTKSLIWSAEHKSCADGYCIYALDFADGTMFPLLAAKGGTVFYAKDICANGVTDCTNMLILKDVSTSPVSYQVYYHLANNSIPAALHHTGTVVSQGDFIGLVDDTGYSAGHHLHFMVHTNSSGVWGVSVDITFRDVAINWDPVTQGGHPRTQAGAAILGGEWQTEYTSGNVGTNPPTGGLYLPADKTTVASSILATSGWGMDNLGVTRLQLIAYYDNAWHEVGEAQTANPFNYALNVCSAGIPVGPFDLALKVWDYEGNQSPTPLGIRHLVNAVDCPEQVDTVCTPDSYQAAIYTNTNFTGTCRLLGIGNHTSDQFTPVPNNAVSSVLLGKSVRLLIYDGLWDGRRESVSISDRNLMDNPIENDRLSSASVQIIENTDPLPALDGTDPHGPSSARPTEFDSITLAWQSDGATKYQARIFSGIVYNCSASPLISREPLWSASPTWSIGTLPARDYTWCVQGRISEPPPDNTPYYSEWAMRTFTVTSEFLPNSTTRTLPYFYDAEESTGDWTASGLWRRIPDSWNASNDLWACNNSGGDYADSNYGGGDLTSPPIQIPTQGATLRFKYRYETESDQIFWDQRWVQVSENDGRFHNLVQLNDDAMNTWLTSPAIDLTDYAGSIVRIRFHFSIADKYYNSGLEGWLVDEIRVTVPTVEGCEESTPDTLATAQSLEYGDELSGVICPAGDVDYYKFSVTKGDKLIALVKALQLEPSSLLDTHLTLMDQNVYGNSPLYSHDDMLDGVMTDSQLYLIAPESGTYYLKVKSGDHPVSGGADYFYTISLIDQPDVTDAVAPNLMIEYPGRNDGVPSGVAEFSALVEDYGSGVSRVDFWWHSPNWVSGTWALLASDAYGGDGWHARFDGSAYSEGQSGSLAVIAYDWAGNARVLADWVVPIDDSPPSTALHPLPAVINGNGIYVSWTATDAISRIQNFDIQYQLDGGGTWQNWPTGIPGDQRGAWLVGETGHRYDFRMRGRDTAGNQESYPTGSETNTLVSGSCTPDSYDQGDGDDVALNAAELTLDMYQEHNYCQTDDIDWVKFTAQAGQTYLITVWPDNASPLGSALDLYQTDESNLLFHSDAPGLMSPLMIKWHAPADGLYLLKLTPMLTGIMGDNTAYNIRVGSGNWLILPIINDQ